MLEGRNPLPFRNQAYEYQVSKKRERNKTCGLKSCWQCAIGKLTSCVSWPGILVWRKPAAGSEFRRFANGYVQRMGGWGNGGMYSHDDLGR